jgi:hypothetical protein
MPPLDPGQAMSVINFNKVSPNPTNFDHPFTSTLSSIKAYFDPKYQKLLRISFDKVSINTVAWAVGISTQPKVETKVGISSIYNDFKERRFDSASKSTDPLLELVLIPSKETVEIDRDYPTLIDTLSDIGGIIDIIF